MEGDAFDILDAAKKFVEGDVALLVTGNLCADTVVGDGAVDDIVVVERQSLWLGAVIIDKVRPFLVYASKRLKRNCWKSPSSNS